MIQLAGACQVEDILLEQSKTSKMKFENRTDHEKIEEGCAVDVAFENHHLLLSTACTISLVLGIPLVCNVLWHLKVRLLLTKFYLDIESMKG